MIGITCGICGHRGDATSFTPAVQEADGQDWVCPECGCGVYVPATLTSADFIGIDMADGADFMGIYEAEDECAI